MNKNQLCIPSFESIVEEVICNEALNQEVADAARSLLGYVNMKIEAGVPRYVIGKELIDQRAFGSDIEKKIANIVLDKYKGIVNIDYEEVTCSIISHLEKLLRLCSQKN